MNLRERAERARANLGLGVVGRVAQAAVAAGISWELALQLPDHGQPFFATAADASQMVRNQAAASAILIVALHRAGSDLALQRLEDALIGGAVAIVIARFLLPIDPIPFVRDEARNLREQLAGALEEAAEALAGSDHERAEKAVERIWASTTTRSPSLS